MINPPVTVMKFLLMSSIEGLLLFFGEHAVVIRVSISLGDQGLALDMITGVQWSTHQAREMKSRW